MSTFTVQCPHCGETAATITQDAPNEPPSDDSPLSKFMYEQCRFDPAARVLTSKFLETYRDWVRVTLRIGAGSSKLVGMELRRRGFTVAKSNGAKYYVGLDLM